MTRVPKTTFGGISKLYRVASRYVKGQTYHVERPVDCNRGMMATVTLDTARQFGMKPCRKCLGEG